MEYDPDLDPRLHERMEYDFDPDFDIDFDLGVKDVATVLDATVESAPEDAVRASVSRWLRDRELGSGGACERALRQGVEVHRFPIRYWPKRIRLRVYAEAVEECMTERGRRAHCYEEVARRLRYGTLCVTIPTGLGRSCELAWPTGLRTVLTCRERVGTHWELALARAEFNSERWRLEYKDYLAGARSYEGVPFNRMEYRLMLVDTLETERTCATCDRRACQCG